MSDLVPQPLLTPQMMSDHPAPPSAGTPLGGFSQRTPHPWCFLSVILHPLTPPCSLAMNSHLPLLYLKLSPIPVPYGETPCLSLALSSRSQIKSALPFFNECHE